MSKQSQKVNHSDLVEKAKRWLTGTCGCSVVLTELVAVTAYGEVPDAIGWKSGGSILVECKTTLSDFHADRKKLFRKLPDKGMGNYRFFLVPEGLVSAEQVPEGWGLLYDMGNRIKVVLGKEKSVQRGSVPHCFSIGQDANLDAEVGLLVSACRRLNERGLLNQIYK